MMKYRLSYLILVFILAAVVVPGGCRGTMSSPPAVTGGQSSPTVLPSTASPAISPSFTETYTPSVSTGERIYNTSTSAAGEPITDSGGPGRMQMPLSCASCHGPKVTEEQ